jgi:alanyl-tRNA synthetase
MTERLYYTNAYLREFEASIVRVGVLNGRASLVLDRTAFYPTSGGQPFDVGHLDDIRVLDVFDDDNGDVVHVVDCQPDALTTRQTVRGSIDWTRRFDHMQQHTGQHVLSAAIERRFGARTVSFHLGAESSTIDLSRELTREELVTAEVEANGVVWEDRPVDVRFVTAEEAARLPLRKEPVREGTLRLIEVPEFDLSACGGTHVATTGGIGVIAIGTTERFKGGQRVEFFCGGRALAKFRSMHGALTGSIRLLSVLPHELPDAIDRLQAESRERQRSVASLQQELARYRADELASAAEALPIGRLVARALDADANGLKSIATAIASRPGHIAVLVSATTPALVVVARSQDVGVAANQVVAALTAKFGGRGGGKPDMAQAGNLGGDAAAILDAARENIAK